MSAELLAKVEFANLLSINWNEQKLQTNFRLIVDAIGQQHAGESQLKSELQHVKEELTRLTQRIDTLPTHHCTAQPISQEKETDEKQCSSQSREDTANLLKQFQKKICQSQQLLGNDLLTLRKQLDEMRALVNAAATEKLLTNERAVTTSQKQLVSGQIDTEQHKQCLTRSQADKKFDTLFDMIDKLRSDNISVNAKLNVQQQTLDSQKKSLASIQPVQNSQSNVQPTQPPTQPTRTSIRHSTTNLANNANSNNAGSLNRLEEAPIRRDSIKPKIKVNPSSRDVTNQENASNSEHVTDQYLLISVYQQDRDSLDGQIGNVLIDMSTLKLCYQELKMGLAELRKSESQQDAAIDDLASRQESLRKHIDIERDRVDREIKNLKLSFTQLTVMDNKEESSDKNETFDEAADETDETSKEGGSKLKGNSNNRQKRESDSRAKMAVLQNLMAEAATKTDLERLKEQLLEAIDLAKTQTEKKLAELGKHVEATDSAIEELDEKIKSEVSGLQTTLQEQKETIKGKFSESDKRHNVLNAKHDELRKEVQYLKEDLEYYKNNFTKVDTAGSGSLHAKTEDDGKGDRSALEALRKKTEDMKREYTNKLHDLRSELINAIRDFERRMSSKGNSEQELGFLQDKMEEMRLYLSRKADVEDTKKSLVYLDKKLSVLMSSLNRDDETVEDARAAKKNWFCLSCDKVLEGYSGKVGRHIPWDALNSKHTLKVLQTTNTSKIEDKRRKDPLPTLSYNVKK